MAIELFIILGGIGFGFIGFLIGAMLVLRAYKKSPSIHHYKDIIDILTLRKLRHKGDISRDTISTNKKGHIEHYEDMRDKLTTRKKVEVEESSGGGFGIISSLIGGFITILIGVTLLPEITKQVGNAQMQSNLTNPSSEMASTMLSIVPAFFGIAIVGVVIAVTFGALRNSGVL